VKLVEPLDNRGGLPGFLEPLGREMDLLGIEPEQLRVELHPNLAGEYGVLAGKQLDCPLEGGRVPGTGSAPAETNVTERSGFFLHNGGSAARRECA
jgi:hypothetical protein